MIKIERHRVKYITTKISRFALTVARILLQSVYYDISLIQIDVESAIYNQSLELDVLYKTNTGEIFNGSYYGKQVAFPDFTHPSIAEFYIRFMGNLPTQSFDGIVLVDNWPSEESFEMNQNGSFPYLSEVRYFYYFISRENYNYYY